MESTIDRDLLRRQLMTDSQGNMATDDEVEVFLQACLRTKLDPWSRQIYPRARRSRTRDGKWQTRWSYEVSIDGLRTLAEASGKYAGQAGPFWCGDDGEWKDVWLSKDPPAAAKVGVIRSDFREVLWAVARFEAYAQYVDQNGKMVLGQFWAKMGDLMIAKCAEALALRKAFPVLSGLYTREEMMQADEEDVPQKPVYDAPVHEAAPPEPGSLAAELGKRKPPKPRWQQRQEESRASMAMQSGPQPEDDEVEDIEIHELPEPAQKKSTDEPPAFRVFRGVWLDLGMPKDASLFWIGLSNHFGREIRSPGDLKNSEWAEATESLINDTASFGSLKTS